MFGLAPVRAHRARAAAGGAARRMGAPLFVTRLKVNLSKIMLWIVAMMRSVAMFVTIAHALSLPTSCFRSYE